MKLLKLQQIPKTQNQIKQMNPKNKFKEQIDRRNVITLSK